MKRTDADARVLARVADGDTAALTELYGRYGEPLFAFLFRLAGDRGTAEEILQDTMLAVWRSAGTFQRRSRASTWLFGVARRPISWWIWRIKTSPRCWGSLSAQ